MKLKQTIPGQFYPNHLNSEPELMSYDSQLYQQHAQHLLKFAEKTIIEY